MSSQGFRWRTIVEVAIVAVIIYLAIGSPGLSSTENSSQSNEDNVPSARAKVETLVYPDRDLRCTEHIFDVHVLSTSPLVIYIDGFVSEAEAQHLIDIRYAKCNTSSISQKTVANL